MNEHSGLIWLVFSCFIHEKKKNTSLLYRRAIIALFKAIASMIYFIIFFNGTGMTVMSSIGNVNESIGLNLRDKLFMFKLKDDEL